MEIKPVLSDHENMKNGTTIRLAENLNRLLKKRKTTISQTALAIQMNKSTLHNYCNGVVPRNIVTLKKLADHFEVNLTELMFGPQISTESLLRATLLEGTYELVIRRNIEDSKK